MLPHTSLGEGKEGLVMTYLATFSSQFDSILASRVLHSAGACSTRLMPVPRELSTACGTCVQFDWDGEPPAVDRADRLYRQVGTKWQLLR